MCLFLEINAHKRKKKVQLCCRQKITYYQLSFKELRGMVHSVWDYCLKWDIRSGISLCLMFPRTSLNHNGGSYYLDDPLSNLHWWILSLFCNIFILFLELSPVTQLPSPSVILFSRTYPFLRGILQYILISLTQSGPLQMWRIV